MKFLWKGLPAFVLSLSSLLGLAGLSYVFWLLAQAVWKPMTTIAPIPIPKKLADRGYTPEVVTERLQSALNKLRNDASKKGGVRTKTRSSGINPAEADAAIGDLRIAQRAHLPDIVVPNIGLSVETLAATIRGFLRLDTRRNVSGEVTNAQKTSCCGGESSREDRSFYSCLVADRSRAGQEPRDRQAVHR